MLNKGYERLGFEPYTILSRTYKWFKQLAHYPIYLSASPAKERKSKTPKYLFMSKESLFKQYGTPPDWKNLQ